MMKQSLKHLSYFLTSYLFFFVIAFTFFLIFSKSDLFLYINNRHNSFFDVIFAGATDVGNGWTFGIFLIIAFFLVSKKDFFFGLSIFAFTSLVSTFFKRVLFNDALRPSAWFPNPKIIHFVEGVTTYSHNSFPSGHTITGFALAFYATYLCKDKRYGLLFLIMAILVGYSRIYLGQHFFADVLFGSLISVISSIVCLLVFERYVFTVNPFQINPTDADTGH
jgi:membrane-associated phospholipid phosphatase